MFINIEPQENAAMNWIIKILVSTPNNFSSIP